MVYCYWLLLCSGDTLQHIREKFLQRVTYVSSYCFYRVSVNVYTLYYAPFLRDREPHTRTDTKRTTYTCILQTCSRIMYARTPQSIRLLDAWFVCVKLVNNYYDDYIHRVKFLS
jgi:hypothetical protein